MQLLFEATGTPEAFASALQKFNHNPEIQSLLVLAADGNLWQKNTIDPLLLASRIPVFGGIFPQLNYANRPYERGTVLVGLTQPAEIARVEGLSDADIDFDDRVEECTTHWSEPESTSTMLVFVDGLAQRISALIHGLYSNFGLEDNFVGGGAGSLSFTQKPCIITPQGLYQDTAVLARLPVASSIGVTHGWQAISDSMKVTQAERNVIKTLDWQPAFTVYKTLIEAHSGAELREDNFFDLAKSYPLGMSKLGTEMVVRDPLMVEQGQHLVCVGEVPEGSFVRLLNGTPQTLIAAAAQARQIAASTPLHNTQPAWLFIDCISRVLFLGELIDQELQAVSQGQTVFGAFTLGEIANTGQDFLEFYNKTSVLALLDM